MKGDRGWKGEAQYLLIKNGKGRILLLNKITWHFNRNDNAFP